MNTRVPRFGDSDRDTVVLEIAAWLRHIDRLDEIPGAKLGLPSTHPLWDAAFAIEREFGGIGDA